MVIYFKVLSHNLPERTEKTYKNPEIADLTFDIWTQDLPNLNQE
jgi:hypothetical protein